MVIMMERSRKNAIMLWGLPEVATLWALASGAATAVVGLGAYRNGSRARYEETITLLKSQIDALKEDAEVHKSLIADNRRDLLTQQARYEMMKNTTVRQEAKIIEFVGRIDWLERRERQLVRVLEHASIEVPDPEEDADW
jgi:hypothetical protein